MIITTTAKAICVPLYEKIEMKRKGIVAIIGDGQSAMALLPSWDNWGATLASGEKLQEGKRYQITIELD